MRDEQLKWLIEIRDELLGADGIDLYEIIYSTLSRDKMSYKAFLYDAAKGYGFSPSEGHGYVLDQDWDNPEDFDEVCFTFGDYDSSTISPRHFVSLMQMISEAYLSSYPEDQQAIERNIRILAERYL